MKTDVEYRNDKELVIQTVVRRSHWHDGNFRKMAETYHTVRSAQALEAAIQNGYRHISNGVIGQEYWEDAHLAQRDEMVLYTVFHIKYKRDMDA